MGKRLRLDLDELYTDGYYYTRYDIGGEGHAIVIEEKDKDAFLDEFALIWRKKTEKLLRSWEEK
jgi:hypothetical protein